MGKNKEKQGYIGVLLSQISSEKIRAYLEHELFTYEKKAKRNRTTYYILATIAFVMPIIAALIATLTEIIDSNVAIVIMGVMSVLSSICTGLLGIFKNYESWIRYRYNCEIVKLEVNKYLMCIGAYEDLEAEKRDKLFCTNICNIIGDEIGEWEALRKPDES